MEQEKFSAIFGEFTDYKVKSSIIAQVAFKSSFWSKQAISVAECNNQFGLFEGGEAYGNFCRERICPMCQRRKSIKTYGLLQKVVKKLGGRYLLITLTVRNVPAEALRKTICRMFTKFSQLWREELKARFDGCFRALEVTYNPDRDDFHPHFHCIVSVSDGYFSGGAYIKQEDLLEMWRGVYSGGLDGGADIRVIKDIESGVAEVAKYAVKPFDLSNKELGVHLLDSLFITLRGRRLTQSYGNIREALREVNNEYKAEEKKNPRDCDDWFKWCGGKYEKVRW